jgi:hypothetical protein
VQRIVWLVKVQRSVADILGRAAPQPRLMPRPMNGRQPASRLAKSAASPGAASSQRRNTSNRLPAGSTSSVRSVFSRAAPRNRLIVVEARNLPGRASGWPAAQDPDLAGLGVHFCAVAAGRQEPTEQRGRGLLAALVADHLAQRPGQGGARQLRPPFEAGVEQQVGPLIHAAGNGDSARFGEPEEKTKNHTERA